MSDHEKSPAQGEAKTGNSEYAYRDEKQPVSATVPASAVPGNAAQKRNTTQPTLTDEQILALNAGEIHFSESPSKYPEFGHGTQYHAGAPGVLSFARAVERAALLTSPRAGLPRHVLASLDCTAVWLEKGNDPQDAACELRACLAKIDAAPAAPVADAAPIPMLLFCPRCGTQHIDAPEVKPGRLISGGPNAGRAVAPKVTWSNPSHRSHLCHACGIVWRPADVATVGVEAIETSGKADTWTKETPWIGHNRAVSQAVAADGAASDYEKLLAAVGTAYGYLWHINEMTEAPIPHYSPAKAAYASRRVLREFLTSEQRGIAINEVGREIGRFIDDAERAAVSPATALFETVAMPHKWDETGECCVRCGDKDWMGTTCTTMRTQVPATADERAAFEEWAKKRGLSLTRAARKDGKPSEEYAFAARHAWAAWQDRASQAAAPADGDVEQLAEARKLLAHASEFAMMQLDEDWHERAAALLALPPPAVSVSAPPAPGADVWVPKSLALPPAPGWYLVMLAPDNDWELMSDTPIQVEFGAYKHMPQAFTHFYDGRPDEDITEAVTFWTRLPAPPRAAAPAAVEFSYALSQHAERWSGSFDSIEGALAEALSGLDDAGERERVIWVGQNQPIDIDYDSLAEEVIERIQEQAFDQVGEVADVIGPYEETETKLLSLAIKRWIDEHGQISCYRINHSIAYGPGAPEYKAAVARLRERDGSAT
ncbi:hypothetical protein [Burkholderia gladioli]|uniref:hypothetical protein n=1 Tax=Burkholderia gladioli TaxID=28095 RepID=UPI001640D858|nr:hypothetical protein [Burkholderia gladioli]